MIRLSRVAGCALALAAALGGGISSPLAAQDRPSEADMFGAPAEPPSAARPAPAPAAPSGDKAAGPANQPASSADAAAQPVTPASPRSSQPSAAPDARDESVLGGGISPPMFSEEPAVSDPLTIGGQLYLRAVSNASQHTDVQNYRLSTPTLLDVFFDARPNDRVRGFVLGRMTYDPIQQNASTGLSNTSATAADTGTAGSAALSSLFGTQTNSPTVLLDQLWIRFDIDHTLFVTAGRQHVRWGTAHFWTPADFLHLRRRNPLDVFDARTGTTMLKVHMPIESNAWNFYAYGITEGQNGAPSLSTPAGALRGEFVFDTVELGLGAFGRAHERGKFAGDLSFAIGDIDFYSEVAGVNPTNIDRVGYNSSVADPQVDLQTAASDPTALSRSLQWVDDKYPVYRQHGYRPQIVGGLSYSRKYNDNDTFSIGAEYFYNGLGYDDYHAYPGLVFPHAQDLSNPASFFYLGKHYGALFVTFPSPYKLDLHTFSLSTLGNLSDHSFISRFDYSLVLLTHLRFEAYAAVHYGRKGGEFLLQLPLVNFPATVFDLGIGLQMAI
jgi:hypothetical protein